MKMKETWNRFDDGKKFFTASVVVPGTGCAERLWTPHRWEHPRPGWTSSAATCPGGSRLEADDL